MPYKIQQKDGVRYDMDLLNKTAELIAGQGDGRISKKDAVKLFVKALDSGKLTDVEVDTLIRIKRDYNFTRPAQKLINFLTEQVVDSIKKQSPLDTQIESMKK